MLGNRKLVFIVALLTSVVVAGVVSAVDVPKKKAEITLDYIKGKKGKVKFPHAKHPKEFKDAKGKPITCKTCHHTQANPKTAADVKKMKACSKCHVAEGGKQGEWKGKKAPFIAKKKANGKIDKKSVIFHKRCRKCHKAVAKARKDDPKLKKLGKCKTCHKKK